MGGPSRPWTSLAAALVVVASIAAIAGVPAAPEATTSTDHAPASMGRSTE